MKSKKEVVNFVCSECGYDSPKWMGKCPNCGAWNSFKEFKQSKKGGTVSSTKLVNPIKLIDVEATEGKRTSSKIGELDRVLGNGFVQGSVLLLAGEPGIGKSTLLLELTKNLNAACYVCGEESPQQVKIRARRLGVGGENLILLPETNVERLIGVVEDLRSKLKGEIFLIIDSIQTLWSENLDGYPGSISQVRGCSQRLLEYAKKNGITSILVGHVNKEGEIAGPMILSHMVDGVFFLEGERFTDLRLLRGIKNRFGPTDEVGVFRMTEKGMVEVSNPSELFLADASQGNGSPGSVITCAMEGTRPMLLEIQALVTQSSLAVPRRVVSGVDYNRVVLLSAVLQKTLKLPLYKEDIFVKVAGGFKIVEPAADLAICMAIISSFKNAPISPKTVVFGEVGLLGEVRRVSGEEKRKKEAQKLGFSQIFSASEAKTLKAIAVKIK